MWFSATTFGFLGSGTRILAASVCVRTFLGHRPALRPLTHPTVGLAGHSACILVKPITWWILHPLLVARMEGGWATGPPPPGLHFNPGFCPGAKSALALCWGGNCAKRHAFPCLYPQALRFPVSASLLARSSGRSALGQKQPAVLRCGGFNPNWGCGQDTDRPLRPETPAAAETSLFPGLYRPGPDAGDLHRVRESLSCPYLDIFFFSHSDGAVIEVVPKASARSPVGHS